MHRLFRRNSRSRCPAVVPFVCIAIHPNARRSSRAQLRHNLSESDPCIGRALRSQVRVSKDQTLHHPSTASTIPHPVNPPLSLPFPSSLLPLIANPSPRLSHEVTLPEHDFMVLSQLAEYLHLPSTTTTTTTSPSPNLNYIDDGRQTVDLANMQRRQEEVFQPDTQLVNAASPAVSDEKHYRPPYIHAMLAGGLGGTMGDMLMHSLDTVKTRQQGDPHLPPKYSSMGNSYLTILRQEGIARGLYGGVTPAFLGSFAGTFVFFGAYEWSKRWMLDHGAPATMAYLSAGFVADLVISPMYVPTEVLKTRLQLQGRYNNPFFSSGYNYRSMMDALRTIYRTEGLGEFFSGYKATIYRDLPFSAIQFAIYEQEQRIAKKWAGTGEDIGLPLEIFTGFSAGGIAGAITCPMDVVKTRIQTELDPEVVAAARQKKQEKKDKKKGLAAARASATTVPPPRPTPPAATLPSRQRQAISTTSPSTTLKRHGQVSLDTESVLKALRIIYRTEGLAGWFRGVGPRFVWTGTQSSVMLLVYQKLLKWFDSHPLVRDGNEGVRGFE